jgi:hypothetical protein
MPQDLRRGTPPLKSSHSVGSVSPELLGVSSTPVAADGGSGLGSSVTLVLETTGLLASGSETSHFSVTVLAGADPVDAGVSADCLVLGINEDDFEELEGGVLANPVRVEDTEVGALAANTHLSDSLVGLFLLELADTVVNGLTENDTFADVSLTATTSYAGSVDDVALGSLVTETVSLVSAGRTAASVDGGKLSEFPSSNSEHETEQV